MTPILSLLAGLLLAACQSSPSEPARLPVLELTLNAVRADGADLQARYLNATHGFLLCRKATEPAPSAQDLVQEGTSFLQGTVPLSGLESGAAYVAYGTAVHETGVTGAVETVAFTTVADAQPYIWEAGRELPTFSDLALCYGGSAHRVPYLWEKERFAPFVSYTDPQGTEHWLFDAFLAIEFVDTGRDMALGLGYNRNGGSADQACWQALLDYWFTPGNGFDALEKAIAETAARIGEPETPRTVLMTLPDPIPHRFWADETSSTTYWGTLNGRPLDMSRGADRLTALRWFADQARERWDKARFPHLCLGGFYILSEDLGTGQDGWDNQYKCWDDVYPAFADYLHAVHEGVYWIPYYAAAGWTRWEDRHIDYAYMQPNYFWGKKSSEELAAFFSMILPGGMGMELEMDTDLLAGHPDHQAYRARFYEYMQRCKDYGVYEHRRLAYYLGQNALVELAQSRAEEDRALYDDFAAFILGHTAR